MNLRTMAYLCGFTVGVHAYDLNLRVCMSHKGVYMSGLGIKPSGLHGYAVEL